jgi:thioesterase domain-containing protein
MGQPHPNIDALCAELQTTWRSDIPLAAAMGIEVASFAAGELVVRAPRAPNVNVHGTAFAGSLFSVCVLTGWGAVWLALREHGTMGLIVVADSRIQYRRPVTGDILCRCRLERAALEPALAALAAKGRAMLPLLCTIDVDGKRAVDFEGTYVVNTKQGH